MLVTTGLRNDERSIMGQPIKELPSPNRTSSSPKLKLPNIINLKRAQSVPKILPSHDSADENESIRSNNSRRSRSGHAKL